MLRSVTLLVLCCVMMMVPVLAEGSIEIPDELEPKAVLTEEQLRGGLNVADEIADSLKAGESDTKDASGLSVPTTSDQVTVGEDGTVTVVSGDVSVSVLPPFGTMAFGQDVLAQFDIYGMFSDPAAMVEHLQSVDAHLCVIDLASYSEIYVILSNDFVSAIVSDIDEVSDDLLTMLAGKIQEATPEATVSLSEAGENSFIMYDYRKTDTEIIICSSVKNNTTIDFLLLPGGDTITDTDVATLRSVLEGALLTAA